MMQRVPFIPENAPFTAEQRSWLNGYFAGLFARTDPAALPSLPAAPSARPLTILFGSQTGTAEGVAREAAELARKHGLSPRVLGMDACSVADLPTEERLLVITSTYGDGELPDNAQAFWAALNAPDAPRLEKTRFAVLALGDTNYETFCAAGKAFDSRLEELGAQRAYPRVDCDVDYEAPFQGWIDGALPALTLNGKHHDGSLAAEDGAILLGGTVPAPAKAVEKSPSTPVFNRKNPFAAALLKNIPLTGADSSKETRHYELALTGSGLAYEPGDALAVLPRNCPKLVEATLAALGCHGEETVTGADGAPKTLRQALTEDYEIKLPARELLAAVADRAAGELARLLEPAAKARLDDYLWGRETVDILLEFPKARFAAEEFVGLLKRLQHRSYSISSSRKLYPEAVHLTIASVRYTSYSRARKGVCSTFLAERTGDGISIPVFLIPNKYFGVPADDSLPMIMVGPGTGVAPFRAFLQERRARGASGKNWLFFGERNGASDFLYREELENYRRDGLLTRLELAFSRDQAERIYVQHRMLEQARELYGWLQEGGCFYVCGDAQRMARDVDMALHQVLQKAGGLSETNAVEYVNRLKKEKRYVRDVY